MTVTVGSGARARGSESDACGSVPPQAATAAKSAAARRVCVTLLILPRADMMPGLGDCQLTHFYYKLAAQRT